MFDFKVLSDSAIFYCFRCRTMILIVCFSCFVCGAVAQQTDISSKLPSHWYIGASGGVGFAQSTFSSFAFNSIYPGAATSLFAGYSFNNLLALELGLSYDWLKMGAAPCCQYLWLSENIKSFFAPVAGQKNWAYSKLNSITHLAALDVCLNFDLLRSFMPHSQWILQLSPSISANLSSASLMTDNQTPIHSANSWHFGAGGDVAVGYSLNSAVDIKLFAGAQYLFGGAFDALPQSHHHNGFVCHSGVSFCYHFPKSKPRISNEISVNPITPSTTITHSTTRTPSTPAVQEVFTSPDTIPQIVDTIPQIQPQFQPEIPIVEPTDSMVEYDSIVSQNVI